MLKSNSPIIKFTGYFIIGFFLLVIIISFGMPDFVSRMGMDKSTIAVVNGEKIHYFDFMRYRDSRYRNLKDKKMDDLILNNYIGDILLLQHAKKIGIESTDERVASYIKGISFFQDPSTGKYDSERFKIFLKRQNLTYTEFHRTLKDDMVKTDFYEFLKIGSLTTPEEIKTESVAASSKIKIKYGLITTRDLKKQFADKIAVSEKEISAEMSGDKKEIKDPKTDRERIKQKLEDKKIEALKKEFIEKLNAIYAKNGTFREAESIAKWETGFSKEFKLGESIKEESKKEVPLNAIESSSQFTEKLLSLKNDRVSPVIDSPAGLFIFTTIQADIKTSEPDQKEADSIKSRLEYERSNMALFNLKNSLLEKSKIAKNLKMD